MTTAALLTPPGTGAIATIAVTGPESTAIVQSLFSMPLDSVGHFRFGKLAGDDVVVAATVDGIEIHCHGGRRIVQHILDELTARGCAIDPKPTRGHGRACVQNARTLRTAGILVDQMHGAFELAIRTIVNDPMLNGLDRLAALVPLGRHLVEPWTVALAGAPNAGKSSLKNVLLGYERSVVAPTAGTTRDAVSSVAAFDGWTVMLTDTAGLRESSDPLEAAGVGRAQSVLAAADLIVWVVDATSPVLPDDDRPMIVAFNKCDLPIAVIPPDGLAVSAKTGEGVPRLIAAIVRTLVPAAPDPGEAVPFSPRLADQVCEAHAFATTGRFDAARQVLAACLSADKR